MQQNPEYRPNNSLSKKIEDLQELMQQLQPGILAVSGGLDSRFLAHMADAWNLDYQALFFQGPQMTPREKTFAHKFLRGLNIPFSVLEINPLEQANVAANNRDRCYFCKSHLFESAQNLVNNRRQNILEGSHLSDANEYRPGHRALQELQIISPLARAGFYKGDIRSCAHYFGLVHPDQSSRPCILTRFDYGYKPNTNELHQIAGAEDRLCDLGLKDFRIRVLADKYCLQVKSSEQGLFSQNLEAVEKILQQAGLTRFEIIFSSRVSGFFDWK
ncbi:MAG: hypothetical protein ACOCZ2_04490 [Thermodesulfobacteriota bacterium]